MEDFGPLWHFIIGQPDHAAIFQTVEPQGAARALAAGLIEEVGGRDGPLWHVHSFRLTRQGHRQRIFDQVLREKTDLVRARIEERLNPPLLRAAG